MILQIGNADNKNKYLLKDKREFRVVLQTWLRWQRQYGVYFVSEIKLQYQYFMISYFNIFSSPELKAQVSYSDRRLSVVRPSVRLSVNFYIFDFFSRTAGPILTKLGTNHPWGKGILNC